MPNTFLDELYGTSNQKRPGTTRSFLDELYGNSATEIETQNPAQERPSGVLGNIGRGTAASAIRTFPKFAGTAAEYVGARTGIKGLQEAGKTAREYWEEIAKPYDPPRDIQGSIFENPELMLKASWWAYNVPNTAVSMLASMIPGAGAYKALRTVGYLERAALIGASVVGGAAGGALEGASTFEELIQKGADPDTAASAGEMMALASAGLNALSTGKILGAKPGSKIAQKLWNFVANGTTEGLTEWLEEPSEGLIKMNLGYATPGDVWEQMKQGLNVIPPSVLMGGIGGEAFSQTKDNSQIDARGMENLSRTDLEKLWMGEKNPERKNQLFDALMKATEREGQPSVQELPDAAKPEEAVAKAMKPEFRPVETDQAEQPAVSMEDLEAQYEAAQTEEERAAAARAMIDLERKTERARLDEEIRKEQQAEEEPVSEETPRQEFGAMQARQNLTPNLEEMQREPVRTPGLYELMGEPIDDRGGERTVPRMEQEEDQLSVGAVSDQGRGAGAIELDTVIPEEAQEERTVETIYRKPDDAPYPNKLSTNARRKALENEGIITEPVEIDGGWALREVSRKEPETVEPWKQTLKEYQAANEGDPIDLMDEHMLLVEGAVLGGKDVPQKVLNDYPTIRQKAEARRQVLDSVEKYAPMPRGKETLPELKENLEKLKKEYGKAVRMLPIGNVGGNEITKKLASDMMALENKIGKLEKPQKDAQIAEEQNKRDEQNRKQRERLEKQLKTEKVFRKVNGWDIVKINNNFYVVDPNTKEEIYYSSKFSRAKEVANESKPETQQPAESASVEGDMEAVEEESQPPVARAVEIQEIVNNLDAKKYGFGDDKIFIHHAYNEYKKAHPEATRENFNDILRVLSGKGKIELSRSDLVEAMNREDVKQSNTTVFKGDDLNANVSPPKWNFIRKKRTVKESLTVEEERTAQGGEEVASVKLPSNKKTPENADVKNDKSKVGQEESNKPELPIPVNKNDINRNLAVSAHSGTSFVPEKRADSVQQEYVDEMVSVYNRFKDLAETDEQKQILKQELQRYKENYIKRMNAILSAKSRTISPMITGPAKFPTARNQKRMDAEMKRVEEFLEWQKKAIHSIYKKFEKAKTDDQINDEETARLKKQVENLVGTIKGIENGTLKGFDKTLFKQNFAGRIKTSAGNGNESPVREALNYLKELQSSQLKSPIYTDKHSIWGYVELAKKVKENQSQKETIYEDQVISSYDGAQIVRNQKEDRIKIYFEEKPNEEIRKKLKGNGWNYSRTNNAWQRKYTLNAERDSKRIIEEFFTQKETSEPDGFDEYTGKEPEQTAQGGEKVQKKQSVDIESIFDEQVNKKVKESKIRKPIPVHSGKSGKTFLPDNTSIEFQYAVVELSDLIPSHDEDFNVNKDFPESLQPRDRGRFAAKSQVEEIAADINPERLAESSSASTGAPIITESGVVLSGNGRTIALKKAYSTKRSEGYKQWVIENASQLGVKDISRLKQPILVRINQSDINLEDFVKSANVTETIRMSASEQASQDAHLIDDELISLFNPSVDGDLTASNNRMFMNAFLRKLDIGEQGDLLTSEGNYTKKLVDRVRSALFEKAYHDLELLSMLAEEANVDIQNIINALVRSSGRFIHTAKVDKSGEIKPLIEHIVASVHLIRQSRREGTPLREMFQQEIFFDEIPIEVKKIASILDEDKRSAKRISYFLSNIADNFSKKKRGDLNERFFEDPVDYSPISIIDEAIEFRRQEYGKEGNQDLFEFTGEVSKPSESSGTKRTAASKSEKGGGRTQSRKSPESAKESLKNTPRFAIEPQESFKGQPGGFGSVSLKTLQKWADSVQDQFSIPINVVQSASGLPGRYQDAAMAAMKSEDGKKFVISGMYEPVFDEIYIIADGIRDRAHFEKTLLHESVGHAGLRRVFGADYQSFLKKIADSPDFQDEIYEYAVKNRYDVITAADEWFANHVENETIDRTLWRRFVDMVRRVMRRMGFKSYVWNLNKTEFSKADLKELVRRSREAVMSENRYYGLEEQGAFSQSEPGPVYYSQMERTFADKLPGKGTKQSYREAIRNWAKKGEFKEEELEWSGLLGTVGSPLYGNGSDKVSKQEIMDWLDGEKVEIVEVEKSQALADEKAIDRGYIESLSNGLYVLRTRGLQDELFEKREDAESRLREISAKFNEDKTYKPKFDERHLLIPGGENYREVLLTLPKSMISDHDAAKIYYERFIRKGEEPLWKDLSQEEKQKYVEETPSYGKTDESNTYRSSHWDEPNVLAHVRLNNRVDADGKKVLFVEEIQSDWHQAGRKSGYIGDDLLTEEEKELQKLNGFTYKRQLTSDERKRLDYLKNKVGKSLENKLKKRQPPNAPFKKTWPLLAMKRIIRMAAEGGYDRIAWTNGEQQAERYDLSKQIERISLTKRGDKFDINGVYDKNNKNIYKDLNIPANEEGAKHLENIIGKELSTKIINDAVNKKDREGWSYSGLDLKVGGEGMKGFYDNMLPSIVNKYVKKWGAKVGETTINTKQGVGDSTENFVVIMPDGKERRLPVRDYSQAKRLAEKWGGKLKGFGETVHSFDITPDMQQAALAGQPLFKKTPVNQNPSNQIVLDPETFFQKFSRNVQDKLNRIMTMQSALFGEGKEIPDEYDVYGSARFLMGKIRTSIEDFYNRFVKDKDSFLNRLTEAGISIEDMNHYLVAKRFPYYMRMVLRNNPKRDLSADPLFMTEDEADDIVATFEAKDPNYKKFGREIWQAYKDDLQASYDTGLISKEEQDRLNREDPYHVAFKSDPAKKGKPNYPRTGKGLSITRKEFYKPMGRQNYPDNSIAQLLVDHHERVLRTEKNQITERLWALWDKYGDQLKAFDGNELFTVKKQQYRPRYDKNGEISYMEPVITDAEREGIVVIHKRNEMVKDPQTKQDVEKNFIYTITINDRALAESMKNLGVSKAIPYISKINQLLRNTAITLNPEFVFLTNMMRDIQTAGIHISGEYGDKMNVKIMKDVPAAIRGIWRGLRGGTPTEMTKWYNRARELGVPTGWGKQKNNAEILRDMTATVNRFNRTGNKLWETLESMYGFMEDMNESVELAVRVATLKNLVENGVDEKKAAFYAKNLTVDFDLKGNWGTVLNSLYLFSNAGIQGTWRVAGAVYKSKKVRGIVTGMVAASLLQSMWNRSIDPDEWDRVSYYDKDNHWLFMIPGTKKMISIKVPYGYNLPVVLGRVIDDYWAGKIGETKAFTRVLNAANDAFNPIGGGSFFQFLSPTFLDPVVQIAEDKNFFGGPIYKEQSQFAAKKPDSQMYFDSVRPMTKEFADFLNQLTGGNERVSGALDINPEIIDHVIDTALGGAGKFVANAVNTGRAVIEGEKLDVKQIPLVRQVIKSGSEWTIPKIVREMVDESGRTVFDDHERELFKEYLIKAVRAGEIKPDYAKRMRTEFYRNQINAQASYKRQ